MSAGFTSVRATATRFGPSRPLVSGLDYLGRDGRSPRELGDERPVVASRRAPWHVANPRT